MQDTQLRLGVALVLALVIVSLGVQFWEPEEAPVDDKETSQVWTVDADMVDRIELERPDGRVVLGRDGTSWNVLEPYRAPAERYIANDLLTDLADISYGVPVDGTDADAFGLANGGKARVRLTLRDGSTRELVFGSQAPGKKRTYVRAGSGPIVAVSGEIGTLDLPIQEFRDRRVLQFKITDVVSTQVDSPGGTLVLEKLDDRWWSRGFTRADDRKVEDLLLSLLDLRFEEIAESEVVPLRDGAFDVLVTLADARTIGLHAEMPTGAEEPVMISVDGGLTGLVKGEAIAFLGQGPSDVGDPSAFPVDRTAATTLSVELGSAKFSAPIDDTRVGAVLAAMSDASVHYRPTVIPPPAAKYGSIRATLGLGERRYDVYQVVDESFRVVQDAGGGGPYLVPTDQIDAIEKVVAAQ